MKRLRWNKRCNSRDPISVRTKNEKLYHFGFHKLQGVQQHVLNIKTAMNKCSVALVYIMRQFNILPALGECWVRTIGFTAFIILLLALFFISLSSASQFPGSSEPSGGSRHRRLGRPTGQAYLDTWFVKQAGGRRKGWKTWLKLMMGRWGRRGSAFQNLLDCFEWLNGIASPVWNLPSQLSGFLLLGNRPFSSNLLKGFSIQAASWLLDVSKGNSLASTRIIYILLFRFYITERYYMDC